MYMYTQRSLVHVHLHIWAKNPFLYAVYNLNPVFELFISKRNVQLHVALRLVSNVSITFMPYSYLNLIHKAFLAFVIIVNMRFMIDVGKILIILGNNS